MANEQFKTQGYRIKLFDCYRPAPAQQLLWNIKPDKRYVAPPEKGSMHSRGLAVDLTLEQNGVEVDMGTAFDFFCREAWSTLSYPDSTIEGNRQLLASVLKSLGFVQARSEWWHFSLPDRQDLHEWQCPCPEE